ncbi:class I tRNA ligase family protein [Mycoplasmopsis verecunda]|uniref:Cysteinyl-tRNA synthetase n=1 Tax=Mycoplasmopsis verecunda TaxID=171291 RepID=A0A1T4LJ95_9BACT|nr:class I tRNA ligase family protein [Mycoplasmopsis verecunda]WPB54420.1 class I tRNA ligase family protein [Mycoplasmopsis verecunda]SJZ54799.1 cysteinyl-tRNA synthetase [Mycoplasmopsis verecunda]
MTKIYTCGPTVYNDVHIGNLRPIVTMDLILKAYRALGKEFKFVHNITDIDDKIINKAFQTGRSESEIAKEYANKYLDILNKFNVDTITNLEYVTENLDLIIKFISNLINIGAAYQDAEGNVWFDVLKYQDKYGTVSNQKLQNMVSEESEFSSLKKSPFDFALWKKTKVGVTHPSPFSNGRPGWHTECAVLINKHFENDGVDIHSGGMDLTFPHHENENIQFLALTGNNIAKNWLRTGQINLNGIKMSKSLQNVILPKDFLNTYSADVLKTIFLQNGFTSEINIDEDSLKSVTTFLNKIKRIYFTAYLNQFNENNFDKELFTQAMQSVADMKFSNFNKLVNDLIKQANKSKEEKYFATIIMIFNSLGYEFNKIDFKHYEKIYNNWQAQLQTKNYQEADKLRAELTNNNLI